MVFYLILSKQIIDRCSLPPPSPPPHPIIAIIQGLDFDETCDRFDWNDSCIIAVDTPAHQIREQMHTERQRRLGLIVTLDTSVLGSREPFVCEK